MKLEDLQHGMTVEYQTGYRPCDGRREQELVWSEVQSGELYVMRREKKLTKKHRAFGETGEVGELLIVATPTSAEFRGSDFQEEYGYFYNGEEDFLRIVGLGDEAFNKDHRAEADVEMSEIMNSIANTIGPMGVEEVKISGKRYKLVEVED